MNYSLIIARDKADIIAIDGKIPWISNNEYRGDLINFKSVTTDRKKLAELFCS